MLHIYARVRARGGNEYRRTAEHRARQSAAIQQWRPWEHSTGPRSEEGKARVSRNAYKGGKREILRELARLLREHYPYPHECRVHREESFRRLSTVNRGVAPARASGPPSSRSPRCRSRCAGRRGGPGSPVWCGC
jgi:hypothetical protein